jgi:hypothetical protein
MRLSRVVPAGVLVAALTTVAAVSVAPPAASAAAPDTVEGKSSVTVIAKWLNNPRGIAVGRHGWLFVAEAGKGGKGKCIESPEGEGKVCLGASSALAAIPAKGDRGKPAKPRRVVTGLPSLANEDGSFALGLHDISPTDGSALFGTIGLAGNPEHRAQLGKGGRLLGHVVKLWPKKPEKREERAGKVKAVADLVKYEAKRNPDAKDPGSAVDSNPYGILVTRHGVLVTDAGGNDLLKIRKRKVSTVAVFHARKVPAPAGIPNLPPELWMQAVPTTVTRGPDGALYVGELTGFPFVKGKARIWRIKHGEKPKVYATGFTNIIDIAFDRKGRLLVLQITKNGFLSNDPTGALIRVETGRDGKRTELAKGKLTFPGGVAVGRDGAIYVTNKSVSPGGGEVLRIKA